MSAAIWDEPPEAHPGLPAARLSSDALPGRVEKPRLTVRLQLWGATEKDVQGAAQNVRYHPDYNRWDISTTDQDIAPCTTIQPNDPKAEAQRAGYGWAWAIYVI